MTAQRAVPAHPQEGSANQRFKDHFRSYFWSAFILAAVAHFALFAYLPKMATADFSFTSGELTAIEFPPEVDIPPPPQPIGRPATPVMATTDVSEEITIAPTTFESNPVSELPPPPSEEVVELEAAPTFTPFTVAPEILNRSELAAALAANYPPLLKDAGIGGTVRVFFFIDEEGLVKQTQIDQSSGHAQLDEAALSLASRYRFSPALNRDRRVPVWVSFPITFRVTR